MQVTIDITHDDITKARAQATGDTYITIIHRSGLSVELEDKMDTGLIEDAGKDSKYIVSEVCYTFKEDEGYNSYNRSEVVDFAFINIHLPEIWAYREKGF